MTKELLRHIARLFALHVLCLVAMTLCRVVLFAYNAPAADVEWTLLLRALMIGVKFDNLVASYISALPLLLVSVLILSVAGSARYIQVMKCTWRTVGCYYGILYAVVLFVEVADVRYFRFFDNHLNISVTEWFGFVGDTAGMLFGDTVNLYFLLGALVLIALFEWGVVSVVRSAIRGLRPVPRPVPVPHYGLGIGLSLITYGLCFCGIRGSFQRYPLGVSFAYFCDNAFYNRLGINPVFNIIKSAEYTAEALPEVLSVDGQAALQAVQTELGVTATDSVFPLNRYVEASEGLGRRNVVVVLMESMSTAHLDELYEGRHITPYLSALRGNSLYFSNFYSAGVHTNNGITATLYGYGPNFAKATMTVPSRRYTGLPYVLRQHGYNTYVFMTGNPQYDNMNSFLYDNNIERIFSLYDYPADKVVNNFGVPDDYMFSYGLDCLQQRADTTGRPFFALFLTVSNHTPFVIPDRYRPMGGDEQQQIIAYADDALRMFMEQAQQTDWGRNTLFVLLGDHGDHVPSMYDYNLRANSVPCFFVGGDVPHRVVTGPAMQVDIAPTVLGLLGQEYENNTMGIDLLSQSRPYAYFVNNDHLACSDGVWLYSYSINSKKEYLYKIGSAKDRQKEEPMHLQAMRTYAVQHLLVNLLAVQNKWTNPCE